MELVAVRSSLVAAVPCKAGRSTAGLILGVQVAVGILYIFQFIMFSTMQLMCTIISSLVYFTFIHSYWCFIAASTHRELLGCHI